MLQLDRITRQPEVMGGRACIRGMRVTVGMLVGQIGAGQSVDDPHSRATAQQGRALTSKNIRKIDVLLQKVSTALPQHLG